MEGGARAKAPFKIKLIRGAKAPRLIPNCNDKSNDDGKATAISSCQGLSLVKRLRRVRSLKMTKAKKARMQTKATW
jgi:hypothetical protein